MFFFVSATIESCTKRRYVEQRGATVETCKLNEMLGSFQFSGQSAEVRSEVNEAVEGGGVHATGSALVREAPRRLKGIPDCEGVRHTYAYYDRSRCAIEIRPYGGLELPLS